MKIFGALILLASSLGCAQTLINPATQLDWPLVAGSGAPTTYCPTQVTGTTTASSAVVTVTSPVGLVRDQTVTGAGIQAGSVSTKISGLTVTLSNAATVTGTGTLSFYSYGMPYTDVDAGVQYSCTVAGWKAITGGSGSMTWPTVVGLAAYAGGNAWRAPLYSDVVKLFGGGSCVGELRSDGTCAQPPVTAVFGRTGSVTAVSGDYTTAQVTESGNLYFTGARAIAAPLTGYTSGAGTVAASDTVLTAIQKLNGNTNALVTGVSSFNSRTGAIVPAANDYSFAQVSGTPSTTQVPFQSLTTTGSGGAATLSAGVLNIPQYSGGGVSSINSTTGAFTFTGSGVSCTGTTCTFTGSGSGIGSIAWSLPAYMAASPATISASGTQTFSFNSQTANQFFAAPNGSAGAPTFRALVNADLPTTMTGITIDGVTPTIMSYVDFTSSGQTQLNGKQATLTNPVTGPGGSSVVVGHMATMGNTSGTTIVDGGAIPTLSSLGGVPTSTTVNGHALSSNVTVTASDVSLGNVTNDAQTKAAVVPNTVPTAGQIHVGNAGGTTFAVVSMSGDASLGSTGALTLATVATAGSCGDATHTCAQTIDAKGRMTAQASTAITFPVASLTTTGTSGAATLVSGVLNIPQYAGGGSMTYPADTGIAVVTSGTSWGTTLAAPTGAVVGTTDTQTLTNKTIDGVTPATMAFVDPTSSIQTQLNSKGTGTVASGTIYSPAYYTAAGTAVGGVTPFTGLGYFSASAAPAAATAAQVVAVISTTAVANATSATQVNTNTFPAAAGFTSGGVAYFSSTSALASSALLTNHGLVVGGGAGAAPTTLAVGGTNFPLIGASAANPIWSTVAYPASLTQGGLLYASSTTAISGGGALTQYGVVVAGAVGSAPVSTAQGAANMPLLGAGAANPAYSTIGYPTACTSTYMVYGSSATQLACEQYVTAAQGGTGISTSASTGVPQISAGTWTVSTTLPSGLSAANMILTTPALGTPSALVLTNASGLPASALPAQYKTWACEPGLGDGLNAITAGTYLQYTCYNTSGVTWTITSIKCLTDNAGSSTMATTNGAGTALQTGAVTCSASWAAATQSGTTTIANGDYIKFTFVADGASKQTTWAVAGTY